MMTELSDCKPSFSPSVSVITVVYNAAEDLEKTVQSVINQTYRNIEYIIIDGGSKDRTSEVLEQYRDKIDQIVSEPDDGIYDAMNKGMKLATGEYLHFLNAGDVFCSTSSLEDLISSAGKKFDIIYGDIMLVHVNGNQRHHKALDFNLSNLKSNGTGVLCHQAMLARRAISSLYSEKYTYKGELNWYFDFFKASDNVTFYHHQKPVVYYFLGGVGYTNFLKNRMEWYSILIKRFGLSSVFNRKFLKFITNDFKNRYIKSKNQ